MLDRTWYSSDLCLFDAWQYVKPTFRPTSDSKDMIAWAKGIADHFEAAVDDGNCFQRTDTEAKVRLAASPVG